MVKVRIKRKKNGSIGEFLVTGHAGYAPKGKDIVCSAVSVLCYTAVGALKNLAGGCDFEEKNGRMKCMISEDLGEEYKDTARIVMDTIYIGLKQLENSYGEYVKVFEEEV